MGELMNYLIDRKAKLQSQIATVQNFNLTETNQKIARIDAMITKLQNNPGWDV